MVSIELSAMVGKSPGLPRHRLVADGWLVVLIVAAELPIKRLIKQGNMPALAIEVGNESSQTS
jgi:hypothetical protein